MNLQWNKSLTIISNIVAAVIVIYLAYSRLPQVVGNFKLEGKAADFLVVYASNGQPRDLKMETEKRVAVFWATWCAPCEMEISRLKRAAEAGEIKPEQVLLIDLGEDPSLVVRVAKERKYDFTLAFDPDRKLAEQLNVIGTPTVMFLKPGGVIDWMSTGVSPTLVTRAQHFLKD